MPRPPPDSVAAGLSYPDPRNTPHSSAPALMEVPPTSRSLLCAEKNLCLSHFLWPFPSSGSVAERVGTQNDPGISPPAAAGFTENLQHGEALGRCGAKGTAPAAPR